MRTSQNQQSTVTSLKDVAHEGAHQSSGKGCVWEFSMSWDQTEVPQQSALRKDPWHGDDCLTLGPLDLHSSH